MQKKSQVVTTGLQTSETLRLNCAKLLRQHGLNSTSLLTPVQPHEVIIPLWNTHYGKMLVCLVLTVFISKTHLNSFTGLE